ncbi:MAG: NUDIX domain-containing protein [Fusicatenibacter sp.]
MRLLFEIDTKDYDPKGKAFVRPSVRGIIIRDEKVAMVHSLRYDYYKFPGGGMETGESQKQALMREVAEESGLQVIPDSIREYGLVHRVQKGENEAMFIQDNYYFLCNVEAKVQDRCLDDYEAEEQFVLEFVDPGYAIRTNRYVDHGPTDQIMLEREAKVLELLIQEGTGKRKPEMKLSIFSSGL